MHKCLIQAVEASQTYLQMAPLKTETPGPQAIVPFTFSYLVVCLQSLV